MEEKSQRTPSWVWIVLIVAVLGSLGCGLLFGGIGGYLLGSKSSCSVMKEHEYMPRLVEPRVPSPRLPQGPDLQPRMPELIFGARVTDIVPDSAAERAGIEVGDVIGEVDGKALSNRYDLATAIRAHKPGERVTLTIWRPGRMLRGDGTIEIRVTLGEHPDERGIAYLGVTVTSGMPNIDRD